MTLATRRLLLRPWLDRDLEPYCALSADSEVMAFIGNGKPKDQSQAELTFSDIVSAWDRQGYGLFAVERIDDGDFLGFCGLATPEFLPEVLPSIEIGWRLTRASWGNGYGSEAAAAVADWAFEELGVSRLIAIIQVGNQRSTRLAEGLAMRPERRTLVPSDGAEVEVYELTADRWRRSRVETEVQEAGGCCDGADA